MQNRTKLEEENIKVLVQQIKQTPARDKEINEPIKGLLELQLNHQTESRLTLYFLFSCLKWSWQLDTFYSLSQKSSITGRTKQVSFGNSSLKTLLSKGDGPKDDGLGTIPPPPVLELVLEFVFVLPPPPVFEPVPELSIDFTRHRQQEIV